MPTEYVKEPIVEVLAPLSGVVPDVKVRNKIVYTIAGPATKTCVSSDTTLQNGAFQEQPDEKLTIHPIPVAGDVTIQHDATYKATLSTGGKITLTHDPVNNDLDYCAIEVDVEDTSSLKNILVAHKSRIDVEAYTVTLYVSNDGSTWVQKMQLNGFSGRPLTFTRKYFGDYTYARIVIIYSAGIAVASKVAFLDNIDPWNVVLDFKNSAEDWWLPATFGFIAAITTGSIDAMVSSLSADSTVQTLARAVGLPLKDYLTTFIGVFSYCVTKGWCTWDDFNFETMGKGLTTVSGLTGLGLFGMEAALTALLPLGKLNTVTTALASGGASAAIAHAYLIVLSTKTRWIYMN